MQKWSVAALVLALLVAMVPVNEARADDIAFKKIMRNALYGAGIGALVGAAFLTFSDTPSDHYDFITTGAAAGVLAGTAWGIYDASTAYVSLEGGKIHMAMPAPTVRRYAISAADHQQRETIISTRLLAARF